MRYRIKKKTYLWSCLEVVLDRRRLLDDVQPRLLPPCVALPRGLPSLLSTNKRMSWLWTTKRDRVALISSLGQQRGLAEHGRCDALHRWHGSGRRNRQYPSTPHLIRGVYPLKSTCRQTSSLQSLSYCFRHCSVQQHLLGHREKTSASSPPWARSQPCGGKHTSGS